MTYKSEQNCNVNTFTLKERFNESEALYAEIYHDRYGITDDKADLFGFKGYEVVDKTYIQTAGGSLRFLCCRLVRI